MKWYYRIRALHYYRRHPLEAGVIVILLAGVYLWKLLWWLVKKPPRAGIAIIAVASGIQWGWQYGLASTPLSALAFVLVWIALVAERGTAHGLSTILTGVSRLVKTRRLWPAVCSDIGLMTPSGKAAPASRWRITPTGLVLNVAMGAMGVSELEAQNYVKALQSTLYVPRVRARRIASGIAEFTIEWGEHLRAPLALLDIPESTRPDMLCIGIMEDGSPFELPIGLSVLAVGLTGSGKSSFAWAIVYALIKLGIPFRLTIADPKFTEWKIAKESMDASPVVYKYTDSPADLGERGLRQGGFMWQIDQELTERLSKIPVGKRLHVPTVEEPLDVIIVDETLPLADALRKKKESHPLSSVTYKGRAAGEWVIFLSQTAEKDVIGPARDLVPIRLAFALPTAEQTEMALGTGAVKRGAASHFLDPKTDAGVCYVATNKGEYYGARVGFATDADTAYLVRGEIPPRSAGAVDPYSFDRECAVYQYFGPDDYGVKEHKYIGESYDPVERYKQHVRQEPEMMAEVDPNLTVVEWWPSKASAEMQEAKLIRKHHPKWNRQHNGKHYRGKVGEEVFTPW